MHIAIDIDGVLTAYLPWRQSVMRDYFKAHGYHEYSPEFYPEAQAFHCDNQTVAANAWPSLCQNYLTHVEPMPGAKDALTRLQKLGWHIHLVTGRTDGIAYAGTGIDQRIETIKWLMKHQIPYDSLHCLGPESKLQTCLDLHCKTIIDDSPFVLNELAQVMPVIRFEAPYNTQCRDRYQTADLPDWNHIEQVLAFLADNQWTAW